MAFPPAQCICIIITLFLTGAGIVLFIVALIGTKDDHVSKTTKFTTTTTTTTTTTELTTTSSVTENDKFCGTYVTVNKLTP